MKIPCTKIVVSVKFERDYNTLHTMTVEQPIGGMADDGMRAQYDAFISGFVDLRKHAIVMIQNMEPMNFFAEVLAKGAAKDAKEEEAKKAVDGGETWKVRAELDELRKQLARKECQLDGIIKGLNPSYVPSVDRLEENL